MMISTSILFDYQNYDKNCLEFEVYSSLIDWLIWYYKSQYQI